MKIFTIFIWLLLLKRTAFRSVDSDNRRERSSSHSCSSSNREVVRSIGNKSVIPIACRSCKCLKHLSTLHCYHPNSVVNDNSILLCREGRTPTQLYRSGGMDLMVELLRRATWNCGKLIKALCMAVATISSSDTCKYTQLTVLCQLYGHDSTWPYPHSICCNSTPVGVCRV